MNGTQLEFANWSPERAYSTGTVHVGVCKLQLFVRCELSQLFRTRVQFSSVRALYTTV